MLSIITAAVAGAHGDPEDLELDDEQAVKRRADPRAGHMETVPVTLDREIIGWVKSQTVENGDAGGTVLVERAVQAARIGGQNHRNHIDGTPRRQGVQPAAHAAAGAARVVANQVHPPRARQMSDCRPRPQCP